MTHEVPAHVILEIHEALRDARARMEYPLPYDPASPFARVNRASALVQTYLLPAIQKQAVEIKPT